MTEQEEATELAKEELSAEQKRELLKKMLQQKAMQPKRYRLSSAQRRIWYAAQMEPGLDAYHVIVPLRVRGHLQLDALHQSLEHLVKRHAALRTTFQVDDDGVHQWVHPSQQPQVTVTDFIASLREQAEEQAFLQAQSDIALPFDLEHGPLLRTSVYRIGEQDSLIVFTMHHLITDGWSNSVFLHEWITAYRACVGGEAPELPELPVQYAEVAEWQTDRFAAGDYEASLQYWQGKLAGLSSPPALPYDLPAHREPAVAVAHPFSWDAQFGRQLLQVAKEESATLYMVIMAALNVLIHRYTGQEDLAIGTPFANRERVEFENVIGLFMNVLIMRNDLSGQPSFREVLKRVRQVAIEAYSHQNLPFEHIVDVLDADREAGQMQVFNVMCQVQNAPVPMSEPEDGLSVELLGLTRGAAKYDLIFTFTQEADNSISGHLEYNSSRFSRKAVQRLIGHLERVLTSAIEQPEQVISAMPLLSAEEREELRAIGTGEQRALPDKRLFHEQFTAQAQQTPDAIAVVYEERMLTYRELDMWSDHLAGRLQGLGVGPDVPVGICLDRSAEMIVALVAVLKAGGAYIPFDPSFPDERMSYMIQDTGLQFLLTQESYLRRPLQGVKHVICVEEPPVGLAKGHLLAREVEPHHAAYVIYTSGSTGQPKGVVVEHGNLMHYQFAVQQELQLPPGAQYANVSTLAADLGHTTIFPALSSGGTVHIIATDRLMNPDALAAYMERHPIDLLKIVPSHLNGLLNASDPQKVLPRTCIVVGGEVLKWDLVEKVAALSPSVTVYNEYGPTEATVGVTVHRVDVQTKDEYHASSVPIGTPYANVEAYLLDAHQQQVPVGVVGELYIGGPFVTRGYLNRQDVTERSYVTLTINGEPKRLYRTGDRVRYLANGQIDMLGRYDDQVKIRGYRVELGEVEAALLAHESVDAVCAVKREEEAGEAMLIAYYVSADRAAVPVQVLEKHLEKRLARYMIPDAFVCLEAMPLTGNGKIDRDRLPAPVLDETPQPDRYVSPRDRYELEMASIWEEVLQRPQVGVTDNFFDIGGHSLKVLSMMTKIRQRFGVLVPINRFLSAPTIANLCNIIRGEASGAINHCLVEIQKGTGADAPWLFVHPGGGSVFAYYHLARCLGSDATVYGFQSVGLESDEMPLDTVEAMALRYLAEIKQAGVCGPYRLLGWSFGGYVAYDMARILEAEGMVEIALLDVDAPDVGDSARSPVVRTLDVMAAEAGLEESQWRDLPDAEAIELIYTALRDRGLLMEWETERTFASQMSVRIGNATARDRFRQTALRTTPPIRSDLHVFCVQEQDPMQPQRPLVDAAKWVRYTHGEVYVHQIPGNHNSLVELPHAQAVAEKLSLAVSITVGS